MSRRRPQDVRTWIEIDRRSLLSNYAQFRFLARLPVMAVVKSNAYGHGLTLVARLLANVTFKNQNSKLWFGVDSIVEALTLRRAGIRQPILVLGYTLPERYADARRSGITVTVSNFTSLSSLAKSRRRPAFHLKLDTGMHRLGFQPHEVPYVAAALRSLGLVPDGVYSHFAAADRRAVSKAQVTAFERSLASLASAGIRPRLRHLASTGGVINGNPASCNLVRVGIGLYGYVPVSQRLKDEGQRLRLKPVMTWKTVVGELKRVRKGERVGYDLTERVRRDTDIAILPVGYWHGVDRGLSSIGEVLVGGRRCRILGRVSMDMTAVDVTNVNGKPKPAPPLRLPPPLKLWRAGETRNSKVRVGDEAVIIGRQGNEFIGADEVAGKIGTTAYEVLTRVNPLIRRTIT